MIIYLTWFNYWSPETRSFVHSSPVPSCCLYYCTSGLSSSVLVVSVGCCLRSLVVPSSFHLFIIISKSQILGQIYTRVSLFLFEFYYARQLFLTGCYWSCLCSSCIIHFSLFVWSVIMFSCRSLLRCSLIPSCYWSL